MSSYKLEGNHFIHITGDLCEGTFLLIVSVIGKIEEGSCKADIIAGCIYFILFLSELLFFFLPVCECVISIFFKSHIKIWPLIVPAMTIVGSFGLN